MLPCVVGNRPRRSARAPFGRRGAQRRALGRARRLVSCGLALLAEPRLPTAIVEILSRADATAASAAEASALWARCYLAPHLPSLPPYATLRDKTSSRALL